MQGDFPSIEIGDSTGDESKLFSFGFPHRPYLTPCSF
jgi:hypothetical protein